MVLFTCNKNLTTRKVAEMTHFSCCGNDVIRPAKSPDLGQSLSAFSLHCRLSGFEVHFTGEIENLLAFFSDRLFYLFKLIRFQ